MAKQDARIVRIAGRNRRPWALASKDLLIKAATEEIAAVGFDRARLSEIAKRADLTPGSVYTWFENKEDLFRAALEDALTAQLVSNAEAFKGTEVEEHWFVLQLSTLVPRNHKDSGPTVAQKLLIEAYYASWRDPKARKRLSKGVNSHIEMYANVVRNGQNHGKVSSELDPEDLAILFLSIHIGHSIINLAGGPRVSQDSWKNLVVRLFNALK